MHESYYFLSSSIFTKYGYPIHVGACVRAENSQLLAHIINLFFLEMHETKFHGINQGFWRKQWLGF